MQTDKATFAVEFLDLPAAAQLDGAQWEAFQLAFLNNPGRFGIDIKSRQVGWSWTAALDALVDSVFNPGAPYIFVSINQDEAQEKIRYARAIVAAFDQPIRDQFFALKADSQTRLEFANGTRLMSHACRPARGMARGRLYLDEMAHYPTHLDRQIYTAGLPVTTKGGYLRVGSSPLGAGGLFWEIATEQLRRYPGFAGQRRMLPWWHIRALCQAVATATDAAPHMSTEERVYAFGSPALREIFDNMFLEDFQQEYECAWVDEAIAWIAWDIIKANQQADLLYWRISTAGDVERVIAEMLAAIAAGKIEPALAAGVDVGRKRDLTELCALGKTTTGALPVRLLVSFDRVPFDAQQSAFARLFDALPFVGVLIDQNGIGMQLAENLSTGRFFVQGVDFTNPAKETWAVEARLQAARHNTPLPLERDLAYQIHSIRKTATPSKLNRFDPAANEKHHADKFWAWALALSAGKCAAPAPAMATVTATPLRDIIRQRRERR